MKILLVIPSKLKTGTEPLVAQYQHPTMDYFALANVLRSRGADVDFLDNTAVSGSRLPNDTALAFAAAKSANRYDAIFTNSESVSIPLALLLRPLRHRPQHVTIAHKISSGKKALFFRVLKVQREIDTIFLYAQTQLNYAAQSLGIDRSKLKLIQFHADADFFRPLPNTLPIPTQFCSAGLEWRDYPTLIAAAKALPGCTFKIAAASPWSKHSNELSQVELPPNVTARRYEYGELRTLYRESLATIVPLYENDFQAGVTTILESMSVGRPVIATKTTGQKDVIADGVTGFYVPPNDPEALRLTIERLRQDSDLCSSVGDAARSWLLENATLTKWSEHIADAILG